MQNPIRERERFFVIELKPGIQTATLVSAWTIVLDVPYVRVEARLIELVIKSMHPSGVI